MNTKPVPRPVVMKTSIEDLKRLACGFFRPIISKHTANAYLRGSKTDAIVSAEYNVQRGDFISFEVDNDLLHCITAVVWEVTFVSCIPRSESSNGYGLVALSLHRRPDLAFHIGNVNGEFKEDTITGDI